jgi:hypothetical protein
MNNARSAKEIVVKVRNDIGVLHQMCKIIAEKGINILAVHGVAEGENGIVRLLTEDNRRAADALQSMNFAPTEADCVVVEMAHKPGILKSITEKLANEGIDIHHLYASGPETAETSLVVFASSDNQRAVVVLSG